MKEVFRSQADEIRYYVRQLLDNGEEYTVKAIKEFVESESDKKFTDGAYAGSLRDLIKNNIQYISPRRGIYKKEIILENTNPNYNLNKLNESVISILKNTNKAIYDQVDYINPLTVTPEQQSVLIILKETVDFVEEKIYELEDKKANKSQNNN